MYCKIVPITKPTYTVKDKNGRIVLMTTSISRATSVFYGLPKNGRSIIFDPGWINKSYQKQR